MKSIEICLIPELLFNHMIEDKIVVVIDILRATSCMTTALAHGVKSIIPVAELEECKALQNKGMIAAAEREGKKVDGFDLDNSPFSYMKPELQGKTIAMTTSNGTLAITKVKQAKQVLAGSFLNKSSVTNHLMKEQQDVLLLCAGWKGKINLEDAFFAGAMLQDLVSDFQFMNDSCALARSAFHIGKNNPKRFLQDSSHYQRLMLLGNELDIDFCLTTDKYDVLPVLQNGELVALTKTMLTSN